MAAVVECDLPSVNVFVTEALMVTLADAFRHGVYLSEPDTCVDNAVEHYLLDSALPANDVTCAKPGAIGRRAAPGPLRRP